MHRCTKSGAVTLLALWAVHCAGAGTETGNPASLTTFTGTSCTATPYQAREDAVSTAGAAPSPLSLRPLGTRPPPPPPENFDGLTCLSYARSDNGDLRLDLWNYSGPCGAKFTDGTSKLRDGRLDLIAVDRECYAGACSTECFYDLRFVIPDVPADADLDTYLREVDEKSMVCDFGTPVLLATLPLSTQWSGTMCRPLGRVTPPRNCEKHGPCDVAGCTCPEGLTCAPLTADTPAVCLVPCSTDANCPNHAMKCENGSCVIGATF